MELDFSVEPYFDNYDENKNFHKILFRPGYSIQARELNQLQSILQKQIERHGNHIFKDGSMVIPGQISIDSKVPFIKINANNSSFNGDFLDFKGKTIIGQSTGVEAIVLTAKNAVGTNSPYLYCKYLKSGSFNDISYNTFKEDEVIISNDLDVADRLSSTIASTDLINPTLGIATTATINKGVYYTKGHFVLVDTQIIIIDNNGSNPTCRIGLQVNESFITPEQDETLLDNAQNSFNYTAPGAHRYAIDCVLKSIPYNETEFDNNFIQLMIIKNGLIQEIVNKTFYNIIGDELARRTYDESGNYLIKPFKLLINEYRENFRNLWKTNTAYLKNDVVSYTNNKFYKSAL